MTTFYENRFYFRIWKSVEVLKLGLKDCLRAGAVPGVGSCNGLARVAGKNKYWWSLSFSARPRRGCLDDEGEDEGEDAPQIVRSATSPLE